MFQGLFVDGFAGGGGASTGIARAIGRDVDIAINHDPMAIAVHKANHPATEHHCQDIRVVWPSAATRLRRVAGAWFSPDCKEHSKAKGGPVKDRNIRQLPWEIIPWLKETRPTVGYVENVEEMQMWGPLDENGHVIKELRGKEFKRWIRAIRGLGYKVDWKELRACDYGAPTSRKRLYIIMRCDKLKIVWPKRTHAPANDNAVLRGKLKPYRTAAECIDWSIPCPSIFDRKRPLKENTERRIAHGVMRYVVNAARPFLIPVTHAGDVRAHDVAEPLRTITTANGGEFAAVDVSLAPHITKFHGTGIGSPIDNPVPTVTANGNPARPAGATPLGVVAASMAPLQNGERRPGEKPREQDIHAPLSTIATGGKHAVVTAHLEKFNADSRPKSAEDPLSTVMATSAKHAVVETHIAPIVVNTANGKTTGRGPNVWSAEDPTRTITTSPGFAAVETSIAPLIVETAHGSVDKSGKKRGRGHRSVEETMPTATTSNNSAEVAVFLSAQYTSNTNGGRGRPDLPLKTIIAGGQHHAVVAAHIEQANTGMVGHDARKPLSTIVGKGCTQRIVQTTMIEEGALPAEMMAKAVRVAAFLVKYYGTAMGQPADEPFDTVTTKPRYAVVTVTIDAVTYVIVDIGLRMLTPRELARAQGFPENYVLNPIVRKIIRGKWVEQPLTIAEQIRMIGNSVCPDVAEALVAANQPGIEMRMAA
jgi:DNA (cytosine-5)-methyltransferase 1